jgi:transposase
MLYVGIDLHLKQLTVCIRDEQGNITLRRQVSTRPPKVREFLDELGRHEAGYVVMLEVCGFHDWLVRKLREEAACRDVLTIQPKKRSKKKTDRRDANHLSELLWINRQRLLAGEKVQGVRCVYQPTDDERQDRQLTAVRLRLSRQRTRTFNQIHYILRRHNLEWDRPTKTFQTKKVRQWLKKLPLGEIDRLEMDHLLAQWDLWDRQLEELDARIAARFEQNPAAKLLATIVGVSCYMALAISSRVGDVARFAHGRSLANFFGLTPGSRSSGETERLGSITKEGSRQVRFLLGQLVLHVLRRDARMRTWYKRIKQRRGAKIARVAVMRRLAVIMWHMLSKEEAYVYGGMPERSRRRSDPPFTEAELAAHRRAILASLGPAKSPDAAEESTGSSSLIPQWETASGVLPSANFAGREGGD